MTLNKELEDNEKCPECGHLGLIHLRDDGSDPYNAGCVGQIDVGSIFPKRCGCVIRRKNKIS